MNFDLIVDVYCRQQLSGMAEWLALNEYNFSFEKLGVRDSVKPEVYRLTIDGVSWAANIVELGEKLQEYDYDMDGIEERDGANPSPPA